MQELTSNPPVLICLILYEEKETPEFHVEVRFLLIILNLLFLLVLDYLTRPTAEHVHTRRRSSSNRACLPKVLVVSLVSVV